MNTLLCDQYVDCIKDCYEKNPNVYFWCCIGDIENEFTFDLKFNYYLFVKDII